MGSAAADIKYRFQWNFPIAFSPNDPNTLYAASQVLFKSTDGGQSWTAISPDLTRNDKSRQGSSGGPITKDNTSVEYYGTIFYVAESPVEPGVIWTGSDDGLVQLTRDGGKTWKNVTPKGIPDWIMINEIDASPLDKGTAYVAATMYKSDDNHPYLYKTADYGATWTRIDGGIDAAHFTRVIRADPARRGLLYAGTERGMYVSFDDGAHWQPLQLNLPVVPIHDLTIKDGSLVAATHGRAFWVLDDLSPLREIAAHRDLGAASAHLFPPAPSYRYADLGGGVVVDYYLKEAPPAARAKEVTLEILTRDGKVIRAFHGKPAENGKEPKEGEKEKKGKTGEAEEEEKKAAAPEKPGETPPGKAEAAPKEKEKTAGGDDDAEEEKIPTEAGLNRFVWDMSWPAATKFPGMVLWTGDPATPVAVPGTYQARLTAAGKTLTESFEIRKDPRSSATQEDLEAQYRFVAEVRDKLTETHDAIRRVRDVRAQLDEVEKRLAKDDAMKPVVDAAKDLDKKMTEVEEALYQTKNHASEDPLNFPIRLDDKLNGVAFSAALGDYRPTAQAVQVKAELTAAIDAQLAKLRGIWDTDLARFNQLAREKGVAAVIVPPAKLK